MKRALATINSKPKNQFYILISRFRWKQMEKMIKNGMDGILASEPYCWTFLPFWDFQDMQICFYSIKAEFASSYNSAFIELQGSLYSRVYVLTSGKS